MLKNSTIKPGHRRARPWGGWLRAAALTALTAGLALASTAHADVDAGATIPGAQSGNVTITAPTRSSVLRTQATKVQWISHQDCVDNIQLTFNPVVTTPATGKALVVYVSNTVDDCLQNSTRNDTTRCKHLPVVSGTEVQGNPLVTFKAQDLTELMLIPNCGDDVADAGTATAPLSLKIYFMVAPPSEDLVAGNANVNFAIFTDSGIDLWGPPPPTGLMVASGDESLQITFTDGINNDSDRLGYYIYVDDGTGKADGGAVVTTTTASSTASSTSATGTGGAGGAGGASATSSTGVGGNGGASTSSASSSSASSSASSAAATSGSATTTTGSATTSAGVTSGGNTDACNPSTVVGTCTAASLSLVPGSTPSDVTMDTVETGNLGQVGSLVNGKGYVVALAAYDDVGNIGKLSDLACGAPAPVDSILRVYKCDGGLAETGCGFCSMRADAGGSFGALVSAGLLVVGFAARRARRRAAARTSRGAR